MYPKSLLFQEMTEWFFVPNSSTRNGPIKQQDYTLLLFRVMKIILVFRINQTIKSFILESLGFGLLFFRVVWVFFPLYSFLNTKFMFSRYIWESFFRLVPVVIQTPTRCFQAGIYTKKFVLEKMNSPGEGHRLHMPELQLVLMCCPILEPWQLMLLYIVKSVWIKITSILSSAAFGRDIELGKRLLFHSFP